MACNAKIVFTDDPLSTELMMACKIAFTSVEVSANVVFTPSKAKSAMVSAPTGIVLPVDSLARFITLSTTPPRALISATVSMAVAVRSAMALSSKDKAEEAKNLSVNNIHVHFDLPEGHYRGSQVIERHEAAIKFLVAHQ
jgi:hypothetical protein